MSFSITFSLDDGSIFDYRLAAYFAKYNLEATFYLPVNWRKYLLAKGIEPMTIEQAQELSEKFIIGSHGVDHHLLTRVDNYLQDREIKESRIILQDMFDQPIRSFCYPRGYYDATILEKVAEAGYTSARTVKVGNIYPAENRLETVTTAHIGYDRAEYGTDWYTYAEGQLQRGLDQADTRPIRLHFWGHGEEIHRQGEWDRVLKFLKLCGQYVAA